MLNWTRATTTFLVTKYDRSGHLEHGQARLRDIYDNFCQGPQCPEPIDRPKAACYMFAALGIVFNEVNCCALFSFIFIDTFTTEQSSRLVESSFAQGRKMHPWSGRRIRTTGRGQWAKGNSNSSTPQKEVRFNVEQRFRTLWRDPCTGAATGTGPGAAAPLQRAASAWRLRLFFS
jgi:hypothetical protein